MTGPAWRKASVSGAGNCVEVATVSGGVLVRDSKNPAGPVLTVSAEAWRVLLEGIRERKA